jgi:aminoglycoside/choline kinase family phosphotransferase
VSLLEDCYYDLSPNNRENLKKYYYEQMKMSDLGQKTYEEFLSLYDDMLIQRVFKAVGSFCYIYNWRKDERYLKYIGFAMEKIRRTMSKNSKYKELSEKLFKFYYAN